MKNSRAFILSVLSTKGGVTKTTNAANIAAFCADHGIRTLMIDADLQPSLSSYFELDYSAEGGTYEFIINKNTHPKDIISKTIIKNLDLIKSNDPTDRISLLLRNAADGVIRFNHLIKNLVGYDLIIVDTRGARDITLEMAVLASDLILSPLLPALSSTREFLRGTLNIYSDLETYTSLGFVLPPIKAVANCVDNTNDARDVIEQLHDIFNNKEFLANKKFVAEFLDFNIRHRVAYKEAHTLSMPIHRYKKSEYNTIKTLCNLLLPQFEHFFNKPIEGIKYGNKK